MQLAQPILWFFVQGIYRLSSVSQQKPTIAFEQSIEWSAKWDALTPMWCQLNV